MRERQVGFVFQHYALFRHMTVFENVAFGLRVKPRGSRPLEGDDQAARQRAAGAGAARLARATAIPPQLSGGQRQRIALARALAVEPRVLLLDEPFGALDAKVRKELRRWLRRLHDELHITSIFVTHDQDEALEVADRIVLMNKGKVEQTGTAQEVYERPATAVRLQLPRRGQQVRRPRRGLEPARRRGRGAAGATPALADGEEVVAFARPHELDIVADGDAGQGLAVKVNRVLAQRRHGARGADRPDRQQRSRRAAAFRGGADAPAARRPRPAAGSARAPDLVAAEGVPAGCARDRRHAAQAVSALP